MFRDAIFNICRIIRVLRRPRGNLLLLGIGGSGRQSLVRLAAFICDMVIFQIEISRKYGQVEFKEGELWMKMYWKRKGGDFSSCDRFTTFDEIMCDIQS